MISFQHVLIKLVMLNSYNSLNESPSDGEFEAVYDCLYKSIFDTDPIEIKLYPPEFLPQTYPTISQNMKYYDYENNSCYIDSLLMTLFFNKSDYWRTRIFRL